MKRKAEPDAEEMASSKGPSTSKKLAPDANNDFINETELQKSIQVSVLKSADDVSGEFRIHGGKIEFDPEVIAHVSALVWDTVSDDWTSDLLTFSRHAGRDTVNVSDAMLIMRRNQCLLEVLSKAVDIEIGEYERPHAKRQRVNNKESRVKRAGGGGTDRRGDSLRKSPALCLESAKQVVSADLQTTECKPLNKEENGGFDDDIIAENALTSKQQETHHEPSGADQEGIMVGDVEFLDPVQSKPLQRSTPLAKKVVVQQPSTAQGDAATPQIYRASRPIHKAQRGSDAVAATSNVTSRVEVDNVLAASASGRLEDSPKATTSKSPSPDLFNTPVKGILPEFDDDFDISAPRHLASSRPVPMSGESIKNIDAESKKTESGWSAKFSEFSFFDSISADAPGSTYTKEAPGQQTGHSSRGVTFGSRDITSSSTPKHSSNATSKLGCARTSLRGARPVSSVSRRPSSRTPQEKLLAVSVPSSSSPRLSKDSAQRLNSHPSKSMHFNTDSDDDFFDL